MLQDVTTTTVPTRVGPVPCRVVGEGPVTVLGVHGLLVDGRLWDAVAAGLAPRARVVLPDLPLGAHRRPVPDRSRLTPPHVAGALVDLLDGLGLSSAVLVGNDTGGALAQIAAGASPERFPGLALTSCDSFEHFPPTLLRPLQRVIRLPGVTRATVRAFTLAPLLARPGPANLLAASPVDPALVEGWMRPALVDPAVRADLTAWVRAMHPRHTLAAAEQLRSYPGPAVVAWSRRDRLFPRSDAERLATTIPRARLTWVEDALTFSPLDRPDAVVDAVREVLDQLPFTTSRPVGGGSS